MTTTQEPGPDTAPSTGSSTVSTGWQPYRYGEVPVVVPRRRDRAGVVAIVLGASALVLTTASVVAAVAWSSRTSGLVLVATAAILALGGVIGAVLALARTGTGTSVGVGVAVAGTAASAAGFAAALLWTVVLVLTSVAAPAAIAGTAPVGRAPVTPSAATAAPVVGAERHVRLEVTGTVPAATISYQFAGTTGGDTVPTPVPWSKDVDRGTTQEGFSVVAFSSPGQQGSLTCSISDADSGTVLETKTVRTDGSPRSSAFTSCSFYG